MCGLEAETTDHYSLGRKFCNFNSWFFSDFHRGQVNFVDGWLIVEQSYHVQTFSTPSGGTTKNSWIKAMDDGGSKN